MRYAQIRGGLRLHLVYELTGEQGITQPICGRKVDGYRMTINLPMGNACKNCLKRHRSEKFNYKAFLLPYFQENSK